MKSRVLLIALLALAVLALGPQWLGVDGLVPTPPHARVAWMRLIRPAAILALFCAGLQVIVFRAAWSGRISTLRFVALAAVLSAGMAFGLRAAGQAGGFSLASTVYSQGYAEDSARFESLPELLATYNERHAELLPHSRTHPIGPVLLFGGASELSNLAAQLSPTLAGFSRRTILALAIAGNLTGVLLVLFACLWLFPLFALAKELGNHKSAVLAVGLGAALPSLVVIAPMADILYPLCVCVAGLCLWRAVQDSRPRRRLLLGALAGLSTAALLLLSFGNLACLPLLLMLALFAAKGHERQVARALVGFLLSLGGTWLGLRLAGYSYVEGLRLSLDFHAAGVTAHRDWLPFVFSSPYTFFLWLGLPVAVGTFQNALQRTGQSNRQAWLARGLLITVFALSLAGTARGETERLWLALVPFALLSLAPTAQGEKPPVGLIAATLLFTLTFAALTGQYA